MTKHLVSIQKGDGYPTVTFGNNEKVNLKIFGANPDANTVTRVQSSARSGRKGATFFNGLKEISAEAFFAICGEKIESFRTDQYLAGVPCCWNVQVFSVAR